MAALLALAIIACAVAFVVGVFMLPFKRRRRAGGWTIAGSIAAFVSVVIPLAWLVGTRLQEEARNAGFKTVADKEAAEEAAKQAGRKSDEISDFKTPADRELAKEAGVTEAKEFYANLYAIRGRVELARRAAREAARAERQPTEAPQAIKRETQAVADPSFELATAAPINQQPEPNQAFGRGYSAYSHYLLTPAGYPFVRMREDVPLCDHPYAVREAVDAMKAKDRAWLQRVRTCHVFPKGTAVEWTKENPAGLDVVELRIKDNDGGRITAYAPNASSAGISSWIGVYDIQEMRAEQQR